MKNKIYLVFLSIWSISCSNVDILQTRNPSSIGAEMGQISIVRATQFLAHWYNGWDKLFEEKNNQSAVKELVDLIRDDQSELLLPSGAIKGKEAFEKILTGLQSTTFNDRHTLMGIKRIKDNTFLAAVEYTRPEADLLLHTQVEVHLAESEGELKIVKYAPSFSFEEKAILKMMDLYLIAFQKMNIEETIAFYHRPVMMTTPQGVLTFNNDSQVHQFLEATFTSLKNQQYSKSAWEEVIVKVLSPNSAIVSTTLKRWDVDGREILASGATYQLVKVEGSWKIIHGTAHSPTTVIR